MGSPIFLDVLNHEVIHVAQSCFSGSRNKFPKMIGICLSTRSVGLNLNLSHNLYSNKPEENEFRTVKFHIFKNQSSN